MKPWRDIFSVEKWNGIVQAYQHGGLSSGSKTLGRHIQSIFKDGVKLPREIIELTDVIGRYHRIPKTELSEIPARVALLKTIELIARGYLQRFHADHPNKQKDRAGNFASLEAYVWSLAQHAARKADYLTKLDEYYKGVQARSDYLVGYNAWASKTFIHYLQTPIATEPGLSGVTLPYKLEKEDPLHRDVELRFAKGRRTLEAITPLGSSMNMLFAQWAGLRRADGSKDGADHFGAKAVPFFMWLEGTKACLGEKEDYLGYNCPAHQRVGSINSVGYGRADLIRLVYPSGGALFCKDLEQLDAPGPGELFDTPRIALRDSKEPEALAYVFSRGCELFSAPHRAQYFHHSSFLSGDSVRCAGMIKVVQGRIYLLSNDSGHYRPTATQLKQLTAALASCWHPGGVVKYWAGNGFVRKHWKEFLNDGGVLGPQRPVNHRGQARWHQIHSR